MSKLPLNPEEKKRINELIDITCEIVGVDKKMLMTANRSYNLVTCRRIISFILNKYFSWPVTKIGTGLDRDHTTIVNVLKQHAHDYKTNWTDYRNKFNRVLNEFIEDSNRALSGDKKKILDKIEGIENDITELKSMILTNEE